MKTRKLLLNRTAPVLLVMVMLGSLLGLSGLPAAKAESIPQNDVGEITALALGQAWVTSYDSAGGLEDIIYVPFGTDVGYHTVLSAYEGTVIDNLNNSYVLNWRPNVVGSSLRLCGMRVAYRLDLGGGVYSNFYYKHMPGSVFLPRQSTVEWASDSSGGCLYLKSGPTYEVFNVSIVLPDNARIDYLRIYYYRQGFTYRPFIKR